MSVCVRVRESERETDREIEREKGTCNSEAP
jgi:hypothetical protein